MNRFGQSSGYNRNNTPSAITSSSQYGAFYKNPNRQKLTQPRTRAALGQVNLVTNADASHQQRPPRQRLQPGQQATKAESGKFLKLPEGGGSTIWPSGRMVGSGEGAARNALTRGKPDKASVRGEVNAAMTQRLNTGRGRGGSLRPNTGSFNPTVVCGADSIQNTGKDQYNQDKYIAGDGGQFKDTVLLGVFDGHGEDGHNVADAARRHLAACVHSPSFRKEKDLQKAMGSAITQMKTNMARGAHCDTRHSGSTAVMVLKHRNKLVMANIGDSRYTCTCRHTHTHTNKLVMANIEDSLCVCARACTRACVCVSTSACVTVLVMPTILPTYSPTNPSTHTYLKTNRVRAQGCSWQDGQWAAHGDGPD